jgi:hypothetical protein
MEAKNMTLNDVVETLKTKPIYDVKCIHDDNNIGLYFSIGKPKLLIDTRHSGDHAFGHFKEYVIDQDHFVASINSEIDIRTYDYWELKYEKRIIFDARSNESKIQDVLNLFFQGHRIINIEIIKENISKIKIYFSNGMEIYSFNKDGNKEVIGVWYKQKNFGISSEGSLINAKDLFKKIS